MQQKTKKSDPQATFPPHPRYKSVIKLVNNFLLFNYSVIQHD